jgi:predicted ATPase
VADCAEAEEHDGIGGLVLKTNRTLAISGVGGIGKARMKPVATISATVEKPSAFMMDWVKQRRPMVG